MYNYRYIKFFIWENSSTIKIKLQCDNEDKWSVKDNNHLSEIPTLPVEKKSNNILKILFTLFVYCTVLYGCKTTNQMKNVSTINVHAIRLKPNEDLRKAIENYAKENNIAAGWLVTCAGSLTSYNLRFANEEKGREGKGHFEIVSLTGTVSINGSHIHISISDSTGRTIGGHLLAGCTIYTTAEIVMQSTAQLNFKREKDGTTPWEELQIEKVKD